MHEPLDCEHCQLDLVLYGRSYHNKDTEEHYDVPSMVVVQGTLREDLAAAVMERFKAGHLTPITTEHDDAEVW